MKKQYYEPFFIIHKSGWGDVIMASNEIGIQIGDDFWTEEE